MIQTKFVNKIKTHFIFNNFFLENRAFLGDYVEEYCKSKTATNGNIIRCMRFACWNTKAKIQTLRICNTYCFSTIIIVT
jgi:hypothetical protein